jgi:hypothetical protein
MPRWKDPEPSPPFFDDLEPARYVLLALSMTDFLKLLEGGERQHVDRKGPMAFEGDHRLELAKDIIAMANTRDGGTIIIGVSEDREAGTWRQDGVTADQARTFDVTKVHDFVKERVAPPVKLAVEVVDHDGKLFVLIQIPEFDDQPHVCTKNAQRSDGKTVFRAGDLLVRSVGAQSEPIRDESSMRHLLGMAVQKRADTILADISRIIRGTPAQPPAVDPWVACRALADAQSPRASKYEATGSWKFVLYPSEPLELGAAGNVYEALRKALADATVSVRGWSFPHNKEPSNRKDPTTGLAYLQENTDWASHVENFLLFENGFFQYERLLHEDLEHQSYWGVKNPRPPGEYLDWLGSLYVLGEFSAFASRLFQAASYEGTINYEIVLERAAGRMLTSRTSGRELHRDWYKSAEPQIRFAGTVDATALRADPIGFTVEILKGLFGLFQWSNPSEQMLRGDLEKLYTRRI